MKFICFEGTNLVLIKLIQKYEAEISKLKEDLARKAQVSSAGFESGVIYPNWEMFLLRTEKKGASGPEKAECLAYYEKRFVNCSTINVIKKNFEHRVI